MFGPLWKNIWLIYTDPAQRNWFRKVMWSELVHRELIWWSWGCACLLSCFSDVQLFVTLGTVAHQASLSMRYSRQEYWSGVPCPPPRDLLNPWMEPMSLCLLHWWVGFFFYHYCCLVSSVLQLRRCKSEFMETSMEEGQWCKHRGEQRYKEATKSWCYFLHPQTQS